MTVAPWLLRWKQGSEVSASASSNKVLAAGFFCFFSFAAASSFPLAGLGGEGREVEVLARCGDRCSRSSSTLVLVRGAEWRFALSLSASLLLLTCCGGEGKKESLRRQEIGSIFCKRGFSATLCAIPIPVCLAGRGGMEVNWIGAMAPMSLLCLWGTLENSPLLAISKR
jgi:hypothetical protein